MVSSLHPLAALLRSNQSYRRLWYGSLTSQLGDSVDLVAQTATTTASRSSACGSFHRTRQTCR
jgi:hypothetical protein